MFPANARRLLQQLARIDADHEVFGAATHRYRSEPLAGEAVMDFGLAMDVELPLEYRNFLIQIGPGAGPAHGVWHPYQVMDELNELQHEHNQATGERVRPNQPFPITRTTALEIQARVRANASAPAPVVLVDGLPLNHPWAKITWPAPGCIPIAEEGDGGWYFLVVKGELAGTVWSLSTFYGENPALCAPARRPLGKLKARANLTPLSELPGFSEWYCGWLEQALADFNIVPNPESRTKIQQ